MRSIIQIYDSAYQKTRHSLRSLDKSKENTKQKTVL